jgi:hypothetical protein
MTIQEAVDVAVKEGRVVLFECHDSNEDIRRSINVGDMKGCDVIKGKPEYTVIIIIPACYKFFL